MTSLDIVALAGAMEALPCAPSEEPVMEPVAAAAAGGGADAEVIVLSDDDEPKPKKQKPEPMLIYDVTPPWRQTSQATTAATATSSSVHAGIEYSHASRDKWTHVLGRSSVHAGIEYSHASRDKWILFL